MAASDSLRQRGDAKIVLQVRIGALFEQGLNRLQVPVPGRGNQRRDAALIGIGVGSGIEQCPNHAIAALCGREHERALRRLRQRAGIDARSEHFLDCG